MLTDVQRALVYEMFQENFYAKKKKVTIFIINFYIYHRSYIKIFLKFLTKKFPYATLYTQWRSQKFRSGGAKLKDKI